MTSDAPCFARDDMSISARKARGAESRPSKDGPKFQPGARYPSGKLKHVDQREKGFAPAVIQRIVEEARRGALDARLGTVAGVLHLRGEITAVQFSAASRYAKVRGRFDRVMGVPKRSAPSPDYGAARGKASDEPLSDAEADTAKRQHAAMVAAIEGGVIESWCAPDGKGGLKPVSADAELARKASRASQRIALLDGVLLDDRAIEWSEIATLRAALDGLAALWQIAA